MATRERAIIENLFMIANKEGDDVPFRLNSAQAKLDAGLTGRDVIPKARQEGISSYYLARYAAKCLFKRNTRAVVISHEGEATQRMLLKVHYFLNNLRGPKAVLGHASKNEITFPKTGSMFYIGTAGARKFGRGDTVTDLHCSEIAYWENPKQLLAGLFQAVPLTGEIGIESTGNGIGNYYHRLAMRAWQGNSSFRCHFFNWHTFPEYTIQLTPEQEEDIMNNLLTDEEWREDQLVEQYNLTPGQLAFRRQKLEELDYDFNLFMQEYPMTIDECFQASGRSIFNKVTFLPTPLWEKQDHKFYKLSGHPRKDAQYIIGADVGGGTGGDNSVGEIIDLTTLEQVGEWADNRTEPDMFGHKLNALGRMFNMAFINVENNNHGLLTLKALRDGQLDMKSKEFLLPPYPSYLLYQNKYSVAKTLAEESPTLLASLGTHTGVNTKPLMIGKLREFLRLYVTIYSEALKGELTTFIEKEDGKLEAEEGCYDDRVIALAMAVFTSERAIMATMDYAGQGDRENTDPFLLDNLINELSKRGGGSYPIANNVSQQLAVDQNIRTYTTH